MQHVEALVGLQQTFDKDFHIEDFGAIGNGIHKNTNEINTAILAASNAGGGNVIIPAGIWLTASIQLQSNVNLYLEEGAIVSFSKDVSDYPLIPSNLSLIHI